MKSLVEESIVEDFQKYASKLLDQLELCLYRSSKTGNFEKYYDQILSSLHSLRGGSSIFNFSDLYDLVKKVENYITSSKNQNLNKTQIHYVISALDSARYLLNNENVDTDLISTEDFVKISINEVFTNSKAQEELLCLLEGNATDMGKIFIVDDDEEQVNQLREILNDNFIIHSFVNAKEALKVLEKENPDVILTDMKMPEMSGIEFLKHIREINPDIQIIFLSAFIDKKLILEAINYGVFNFLDKPYHPNIVENIVTMAFKKRAIQKVLEEAVNFGFYQLGDYEAFHRADGKEETQKFIKEKISEISQKRKLLHLDYYTLFKRYHEKPKD